MSGNDEWTPGDITSMIANPFYAIKIDEGLAVPHEPLISEDDWITANVRLIDELGAEPYLRNLLSILKGNYPRVLIFRPSALFHRRDQDMKALGARFDR
jgi:hypothetical protein